jgi:hypothetical protein
MRVTVQQRFVDAEFREGEYMEIRLRAKRLGDLRPGDVVEVAPDKNGNLIIKKKGDEHGTATKQVPRESEGAEGRYHSRDKYLRRQ